MDFQGKVAKVSFVCHLPARATLDQSPKLSLQVGPFFQDCQPKLVFADVCDFKDHPFDLAGAAWSYGTWPRITTSSLAWQFFLHVLSHVLLKI